MAGILLPRMFPWMNRLGLALDVDPIAVIGVALVQAFLMGLTGLSMVGNLYHILLILWVVVVKPPTM